MDLQKLQSTAKAMVAKGKGILAIDESSGTCKKRFEALGVVDSEENRRKYRQLLVSAPGIEAAVAGMILYDETLRQKDDAGVMFAEILKSKGILPGIKVDMGPKPLALHEGEVVTEGLDGLRERLAEYAKLGAQFAKWRAVITIGEPTIGANIPSAACIAANAHALARYAALVQEAGLVPMVEPEILMDGDHTIEKCMEVTTATLKAVFAELQMQGVSLPGTILKVSMVLAGKSAAVQASSDDVAAWTVKCLKENVPAELAGVVFLSGGQSDEASTIHLDKMNKIGGMPWPLSFSYGRGIQAPALKIWAANMNDVAKAQAALVFRARMNGLAAMGTYDVALEKDKPY